MIVFSLGLLLFSRKYTIIYKALIKGLKNIKMSKVIWKEM